jgi:hypothetical protein
MRKKKRGNIARYVYERDGHGLGGGRAGERE